VLCVRTHEECADKCRPLGVDRFYELLTLSGGSYFEDNGFFRVVPGFVVQFGINGNPTISQQWENANIPDDPVVQSNTEGTIAYASAGPNTRTTQLFINLGDNSNLDSQGFAPFGIVAQGMDVVQGIYAKYQQRPQQPAIYSQGNKYLHKNFPLLSYLLNTTISL
jgi:peptidyl-prolyl cis-trans isomerase A (cyclophilin A)